MKQPMCECGKELQEQDVKPKVWLCPHCGRVISDKLLFSYIADVKGGLMENHFKYANSIIHSWPRWRQEVCFGVWLDRCSWTPNRWIYVDYMYMWQ